MIVQVIVGDLDRGSKLEASTYQDHLQYLHSQFPAKVQGEGEEVRLKDLQQQSYKLKFYDMMEADTKKYSLYDFQLILIIL